tara:strand:+ start:1 stop:1101 length:1101 start_codon:yes stop_codon:yes gene_type:complete
MDNYPDLNWAIAGRDKKKLEQLKSDINFSGDVLIADGQDLEALNALAGQTKVVLSTAGPFARYGSLLVQACVEQGSHYTDITGENHWVRDMIDQHHEKAASKGVRIIPSCGYDSIPSDIGTYFAVSQFDKPVSRVDVYQEAVGSASGGTTETMFTIGNVPKKMREPFVLNPQNSVSDIQRKLSKDGFKIQKIEQLDGWSGAGLMAIANTRVVRRSAALMEQNKKPYGKDFTFGEHGLFKTKKLAKITSYGLLFAVMIIASPLRHIVRPFLLKPGEGPSKEARDKGWFRSTFIAQAEDGEQKTCSIYGSGDPGYKSTSKLVCESALVLAKSDNLPSGDQYGGVLTSAVGLGDELISRLKTAGIEFKS